MQQQSGAPTLVTRHHSTVIPRLGASRKDSLRNLHTHAVDLDTKLLGNNRVLKERPPLIADDEQRLTRSQRCTLSKLRSGHYCRTTSSIGCCCLPSETYGRNGATPIFRSFFSSQNFQFHHRRLESLEHLMCLIYILLSTTVSHFLDLTDAIFFTRPPFFFFCIHFHFASTLCMCVMYLTSI